MEKILTNETVAECLSLRLPATTEFQKCSFILPDGRFYKMFEHYEAYKFLVVEQFVSCIPDAEQLLSDLGYIRYSWVGYITLADKEPTKEQYNSLELVLVELSKLRDSICVQIHKDPRTFVNFDLNDIPYIIKRIKHYYKTGSLMI